MPIQWASEERRLGDIIPWEHNPRHITEKQASELTKSIRKFGLPQPLLIGPENQLYDGHQRQSLLAILEEFGPDTLVDVRVSSRALTEEEHKELIIRLHENTGQWDFDTLANVYDADELIDWGFPQWKLPAIGEFDDPYEIWQGLPEYDQETQKGHARIVVHFDDAKALARFAELVGQELNEKTVSIWFPYKPKANLKAHKVIDAT